MLTHNDIRQQATTASFSKGRAYLEEGAVGRVRFRAEDNFFSATVSGTEDYAVELTLTQDGPAFWCDCPYDYEGICKHAVALGLAVLEQYGPDTAQQKVSTANKPAPQKPPEPTNAAAIAEPFVSASELEAALRDVPKPEQLKFLAEQLRQHPRLARAFLTKFIGPALPPDPLDTDPTLPRLEELRHELRRALSKLRFDHHNLADTHGRPPRLVGSPGTELEFAL